MGDRWRRETLDIRLSLERVCRWDRLTTGPAPERGTDRHRRYVVPVGSFTVLGIALCADSSSL